MSIRAELTGTTTNPCKLCAYLTGLPQAEREEWQESLALPVSAVGNAAVVAALKRRGVDVEETSVRRHRKNHAR